MFFCHKTIKIFNVSQVKTVFVKTYINNIWLLTVVAASGKEALTPVKIYFQAFELKNAKKRRMAEGEQKKKHKFTL